MRNLLLLFTSMMSLLWSQENGHATAELWLGAPRVESGKPTVIPAAIRMVYEKDWHGYWSNPGEGGMKTELRWKLPAGVVIVLIPDPPWVTLAVRHPMAAEGLLIAAIISPSVL